MSEQVIKVNNLSKRFGQVKALNHVDIEIYSGSITTLLGPNGAGKTTFIEHLLGQQIIQEGNISINGFTPGTYAARASIGAISFGQRRAVNISVDNHWYI